MRGPGKGCWYHAYVVLGIFSWYVLGWRIENREDGELAADLVAEQGTAPAYLDADGGAAMTSKPLASSALSSRRRDFLAGARSVKGLPTGDTDAVPANDLQVRPAGASRRRAVRDAGKRAEGVDVHSIRRGAVAAGGLVLVTGMPTLRWPLLVATVLAVLA